MSLAVFNGSPRGNTSNSTLITSWFLEGYKDKAITTFYLNKIKSHDVAVKGFLDHDHLLFIFPLYVDGMPGQVKHFIELLEPFKNQIKNKHVTFIIHSGFSEAIQNRALETYLKRFAHIMHLQNHGVIIIPGSEGFRVMPPKMTQKKHMALARLAHQRSTNIDFNPNDLSLLRGRETMSTLFIMFFRLFALFGLTNLYWNRNLKKNNAFKERFAAPYQDAPTPITTFAYLNNRSS